MSNQSPESGGFQKPGNVQETFNIVSRSVAAQRFRTFLASFPRITYLETKQRSFGSLTGLLFQYLVDDYLEEQLSECLVLREDDIANSLNAIKNDQHGDLIELRVLPRFFDVRVHGESRRYGLPDDFVFIEDPKGSFEMKYVVESSMRSPGKNLSHQHHKHGADKLPKTTSDLMEFLHTKKGVDILKRILSQYTDAPVSLADFTPKEVYLKAMPLKESEPNEVGFKPHRLRLPHSQRSIEIFTQYILHEFV